jgi:hypothetical protein
MVKTMTAGFLAKLPNFFYTKFGKLTFACQTSSIQVGGERERMFLALIWDYNIN